MRILSTLFPATVALLVTAASTVFAGRQPISSLSVTLRGKTYDVTDVTTVADLQQQIEAQSGVAAKQQGRLIFGGKRLDADTVLSDAGVAEGVNLNLVPSTSSSSNKKKSKAGAATGAITSASKAGASAASNPMADYLKQSGVDEKDLDEMMKSMGGGGGSGAPNMEDSMKAMTDAMKSPLFQQMMSDPERLEQSRQMILNNPMLKSMMAGMPGMDDLLNDPDAWREAMQSAADLYKNMDSDQLMKAMIGGAGAAGMPGLGGGMEGLFDGTLDGPASTAALDELDEDD